MTTRRRFLRSALVGSASLALLPRLGHSRVLAQVLAAQVPLPGGSIAQFVDPLPTLDTIVAGAGSIELHLREFQAPVMPTGFVGANGPYAGTSVWGYLQQGQTSRASYLGPVVVATRGTPTEMKFVNDLGTTGTSAVRAWVDSTDETLHWADPRNDGMTTRHYDGPIPAVTHLHGGEVPPVLDGGPDAWFTSDGAYTGHGYYSRDGLASKNYAIYRYPNTQEGAPIWFHDHALGVTRLNVYAGLAGAYLLTDPAHDPANLPPLVPLVMQDRMFDVDGQLYFPNLGINPEHPFWIPEFVGDTVVVNGKVWPYVAVEPKRYTFLFLNGSNARTYELFLVNNVTKVMGPAMWQIATDGGYLDRPVKIDPNAPKGQLQRLTMMPGERAMAIIDFAGLAPGTRLVLRNIGKTPFPGGAAPSGNTVGRIVEFRVGARTSADTSYDPASLAPLRSPMVRLVGPATGTLLVTPQKKRQLTLNEVIGVGGPLEILVNNTKYDGASSRTYGDFTPITVGGDTSLYSELPNEGDTELWEIVNLTADAHPIHTHLTQFQLVNRQSFDVAKYNAAYGVAFPGGVYVAGFGPPLDYRVANADGAVGGNPAVTPFLKSMPMPPAPNEAGWKDTIMAMPGQVTRLAIRYAPTDKATNASDLAYPFDPDGGHGYVWHCHIIDHEDNEMMRPLSVQAKSGATRTYVKGTDY